MFERDGLFGWLFLPACAAALIYGVWKGWKIGWDGDGDGEEDDSGEE